MLDACWTVQQANSRKQEGQDQITKACSRLSPLTRTFSRLQSMGGEGPRDYDNVNKGGQHRVEQARPQDASAYADGMKMQVACSPWIVAGALKYVCRVHGTASDPNKQLVLLSLWDWMGSGDLYSFVRCPCIILFHEHSCLLSRHLCARSGKSRTAL